MITFTVLARVKPGKHEEFLQAMRLLSDELENQQGLAKAVICQEAADHNRFSLTHEWETQEDWERYSATERFRVLLGALKVLCDESEISHREISDM